MEGLYLLPLGGEPNMEACGLLLPLLPWEEREQMAHIRSDAVREQRVMARILARYLACRLLEADNPSLELRMTGQGKPYLQGYPDFHFNLSHTGGAVVAAVSGHPVGVDIEQVRSAHMRVANRCFCPGELDYVQSDPALQDRRFFEIWTRKEACVKRTGTGIRMALTAFDTLDSALANQLRTLRVDDAVISVCGEALPPSPALTYVEIGELLAYGWI